MIFKIFRTSELMERKKQLIDINSLEQLLQICKEENAEIVVSNFDEIPTIEIVDDNRE